MKFSARTPAGDTGFSPAPPQTKPLAATSFEEGALIDNLRENRNIGPVEYLGNAYAKREN